MKALAIKQPWASLIIHGGKDIENRTWATKYRGPVLVHASKKKDDDEMRGYLEMRERRDLGVRTKMKWGEVQCGGIIGIVDIVDCVSESDSSWFVGPFGFVLANPRPLQFRAMKGALGFFEAGEPEDITP